MSAQLSKLYHFNIIRAFTNLIFYFNGILTNFVVKHRFNLRTTYDTSRANIRRHKQLSVMYWTCKKKHLFCHNYYRELFIYFFLVLPHQKVLACKMEFCVKQKKVVIFIVWKWFQFFVVQNVTTFPINKYSSQNKNMLIPLFCCY